MRVALLHEWLDDRARVDERDAYAQRDAIAAALARLGHDAVPVPLDLDLAAAASHLARVAPDVVFNLVEAVAGQARMIHLAPALLDTLGVPYTGGSTEAVFLTSHKLLAKDRLEAIGVPTPRRRAPGVTAHAWIVKPVWEDASVGIDDESIVPPDRVEAALDHRAQHYGDVFAETFVDGREFNLSLLDDGGAARCLPPAEMRFEEYPHGKPRIVGYAAKWEERSFEYAHTVRRFDFPRSDDGLLGRLAETALACWRGFDLSGYARVDFRVDQQGTPWVLEVNANPCLSPDAGFVAAAAHGGLAIDGIIARLLDGAMRRRARPVRAP
jgi:D-alanine-D-alanine ligase